MIAIDIGANIGYFSALFASKSACVHAFEPNPEMSQIIYQNVYINNVSSTFIDNKLGRPRSVINQCAVGASNALRVKMDFNQKRSGDASLNEQHLSHRLHDYNLSQTESVEVDMITLDEYSKSNNLTSVDIIKIDVEGFEEEALKGAENLIRRSPDLMLCMEYTRGCYSNNFLPWLEKLFSKIYLPKFNRQIIDFEFLRKYSEHKILHSENHLDVVLIRGRRFA